MVFLMEVCQIPAPIYCRKILENKNIIWHLLTNIEHDIGCGPFFYWATPCLFRCLCNLIRNNWPTFRTTRLSTALWMTCFILGSWAHYWNVTSSRFSRPQKQQWKFTIMLFPAAWDSIHLHLHPTHIVTRAAARHQSLTIRSYWAIITSRTQILDKGAQCNQWHTKKNMRMVYCALLFMVR